METFILFRSSYRLCRDFPVAAAVVVCFDYLVLIRFTVSQFLTLCVLVQHQHPLCTLWEVLNVGMLRGRLSWRFTAISYSENHKVSDLHRSQERSTLNSRYKIITKNIFFTAVWPSGLGWWCRNPNSRVQGPHLVTSEICFPVVQSSSFLSRFVNS